MDRREFGKSVGFGALGLPLVANDDAISAAPAEVPGRQKKTAPAKTSLPEADLLLELLHRDFPDKRLTKSIPSKIRGQLIGNRKRSQRLSEFPLTNVILVREKDQKPKGGKEPKQVPSPLSSP